MFHQFHVLRYFDPVRHYLMRVAGSEVHLPLAGQQIGKAPLWRFRESQPHGRPVGLWFARRVVMNLDDQVGAFWNCQRHTVEERHGSSARRPAA